MNSLQNANLLVKVNPFGTPENKKNSNNFSVKYPQFRLTAFRVPAAEQGASRSSSRTSARIFQNRAANRIDSDFGLADIY